MNNVTNKVATLMNDPTAAPNENETIPYSSLPNTPKNIEDNTGIKLKNIGVEVYFCDPYSSWQRGANENCNMLLRGYLPKKHDISKLTQKELDQIADELNNRPRKRLNYQTPIEVYNTLTSNSKKGINSVAVGSRI